MLTEFALSMLLTAGIGGAQPAPVRYAHVVVVPQQQFPKNAQSIEATSEVNSRDREHLLRLHRAARNGDAAAQTELAVRYEMGWGVPIDIAASTAWLLNAVAQGDPNALAVMGVRYEQGLGVRRDLTEAVKYYREAADAGHARAMCYLGDMYLGGIGVPANHATAYRWHMAAIAAGDGRCGTHGKVSGQSLSPEMRATTEIEAKELARLCLRSCVGRCDAARDPIK